MEAVMADCCATLLPVVPHRPVLPAQSYHFRGGPKPANFCWRLTCEKSGSCSMRLLPGPLDLWSMDKQ